MKYKIMFILLILILLLAAFMRLNRISDYMTFLGDEGRDALVAKHIIEGNFTLLGPRSSAGDFFMGPIYYYFMAPFLWLFRLDPVGPAVMVALFGIATTYLIYHVGKAFFNKEAGLMAAALYAISPLVLVYSRSSWNPNVLPFFSLLTIYLVFKGIGSATPWRYFLAAGIMLGIAMQLHYLSIFLAIIVFIYIFFGEWMMYEVINVKSLINRYLIFILGFIIGFSPFLAFEVRHGFPNTRSIFNFIFSDTLNKGYTAGSSYIVIIGSTFFKIFSRLLFRFPPPEQYHNYTGMDLFLWGAIVMFVAAAAIVALFRIKNKFVTMLMAMWLFIGVLLFGFYKKPIYDYHFEFLFPVPFLLMGNLSSHLFQLEKRRIIAITSAVVIFAFLFIYNLYGQPFQFPANRQKEQAKTIANFVLSKTDNKPFNFALISPGNSDHAYRYFFEVMHRSPVVLENTQADPARHSVTDQLLIVCEDTGCQPLGNSLWEVAGFGRAEIAGVWDVSVVKVYKLMHYH